MKKTYTLIGAILFAGVALAQQNTTQNQDQNTPQKVNTKHQLVNVTEYKGVRPIKELKVKPVNMGTVNKNASGQAVNIRNSEKQERPVNTAEPKE